MRPKVDLVRRDLQESNLRLDRLLVSPILPSLPLIFPVWDVNLMAGALVAILNLEVTLRMEAALRMVEQN